jgi:cobalt-zinc-cadmium resistance protein CzcA
VVTAAIDTVRLPDRRNRTGHLRVLLLLGHVRSAVVVTATLIVTPLVTFIVMERFGLSANLMTLGRLAIAIGRSRTVAGRGGKRLSAPGAEQ